jgi:hypothetical protein
MFTYTKNTLAHRPVPHLGTKIHRLTSLSKIVYKNTSYNQGASNAPPAAPPSGGGGGPPRPAPGGGGGAPVGPSYPGGRRPLVMAASTATRRMIDRHGGGNPIHCSRNPSSWIRIHMPSGTSRNTISKRRRISSSSPPAAVGGACDGPAPGSSKRRFLAGLAGSVGRPAASSRPRLSPCGSLPSGYTDGLYNSTSCSRGAKSAHTQNNKQQMVSVSIHQTCALVYQNHSVNQNTQVHNIPLWSNTSPGGNTMFGSPRKSTPA